MNVKRERKITFINVGVIDGSRVWRNHETGVEIIKGKRFSEVGLYYVAGPTLDDWGRIVIETATTLAEARVKATSHAMRGRAYISKAYTLACLEDSDREAARLAAIKDVVARRGPLADIPGAVPGGLCVRDTAGREHVTMRIPGQSDQRVTFTSGASHARDDVATWTVVANFRPQEES